MWHYWLVVLEASATTKNNSLSMTICLLYILYWDLAKSVIFHTFILSQKTLKYKRTISYFLLSFTEFRETAGLEKWQIKYSNVTFIAWMLFLTKDIAKKDIIPLSSVCHSKCTGQIGTLLSQICLWNMTTIINIYIIFNERNWNTLPLSLYPLHSKQNLLAQISLNTYTIKFMWLSESPQSKFNCCTKI